jgi:hypothetical protein
MNTTGMFDLKLKCTCQGYIHKYENLKKVVLNCTITYILFIIEHKEDIAPGNDK